MLALSKSATFRGFDEKFWLTMDEKRSPRSIFESSLEIKCLFFFGVALAIVILISVLLYYKATKSQVEAQNPLMGKLLSEREFLLMHIKGLTSEKAKNGDSSAGSGNDLNDFIDSMASLSEEIGGQTERARFETRLIRMRSGNGSTGSTGSNGLAGSNGLTGSNGSSGSSGLGGSSDLNGSADFYDSDDGPRDDFERKLIDELLATAPTQQDEGQNRAIERTDGEGRYHYYQPLRIDRSCWNCHREIMGDASIDLGAPLGIVQVTIPEPPAKKERARLWTLLLGGAIVAAFLGLIAFYVVIRLAIVKPLRSLREVSEAIGRGDVSKRAELRTGDEFEALGAAFNRMMKFLVATQEKLRSLNSQLEKKVDELAQANLQLYEMNRVKSDFMATMSHELRTPLNSILGFSDVLSSIQTLDEKQKRYVNNINKSGRSLLNMINNVLDLARVDAGVLQAQPSEFRIESVVAAQCDMAKPLVDKKNLELTTRFAENLPKMRQDEARIQQILNNLLSNAVKFTPEGGRIQIEIDRVFRAPLYQRSFAGGSNEPIPFLEMKVVDSGVGVALEDRQIIFEKFRQGKSATEGNMMTREHSGSGLGLSIVKELCKLLEGEVTLESQPGFGSVFIVSLPWELNLSVLTESPIKAEIDSFAKAGVGRKTGTHSLETK